MRCEFKLFFLILLCLSRPDRANTMRKFVYQKDMSEYCKRRAVPSVFLGTHVAEAHSQILHFTKLELPYSCLISVRAELGSNVILVVQLLSDDSLKKSCRHHPNQLLVYEMGETFGGYWGPLPEYLMRPTATISKVYVRKGTVYTSSQQRYSKKLNDATTALSTAKTEPTEPKQDYVEVEIPIVNLTGHFEKSFPSDIDNELDMLFDVTSGPNEQYETSEMPLLQISFGQNMSGRRHNSDSRYDLEYSGFFTSHKRLSLPQILLQSTTKRSLTRKHYADIRAHKKQKSFYTATRKAIIINGKQQINESNNVTEKTWEHIEEILKRLNETTSEEHTSLSESENITMLLESLSKLNHNYSAYLHPWKSIDTITRDVSKKYEFGIFTRILSPHLTLPTRNIHKSLKSAMFFNYTNEFSTKSTLPEHVSENSSKNKVYLTTEYSKKTVDTTYNNTIYLISNNSVNGNLSQTDTFLDESYGTVTISKVIATSQSEEMINTTFISTESSVSPISGTMVDHESWENVVQAAPVMAVRLNQTATGSKTNASNMTNRLENMTIAIRKKRKIVPIPIDNARPHEVITKKYTDITENQELYVTDVEDLAQFVELQDDELHDRVALRYLRQYVGPVLFNICDVSEPKVRHIFLFNSSRIVIAISNFTLEKMTVMLTPARTLVGGHSKCTDWNLECQLFGTRVCIDKMNACDGVPNCGAYDIYDEDRLTCGAAVGLQHNVYLAAITFITVLLTMLYTVHYWLKRCVPKVSQAFFVYTDRAENILYLGSIMRSPHDTEHDIKRKSHDRLFMTEDISDDIITKKAHRNIFIRVCHACIGFITCKHRRRKAGLKLSNIEKNRNHPKKMYSFTEFELRTMGVKENADVNVQTGDSFGESQRNKLEVTKQGRTINIDMPSTSFESDNSKQNMELQMLKLLKGKKSKCKVSCQCFDLSDKTSVYENELYTHTYDVQTDRNSETLPLPKIEPEADSAGSEPTKHVVKHLRFHEPPYMIPTSDNEEDEESVHQFPVVDDNIYKSGYDAGKLEGNEGNAGTSRDHKRFWSTKKKSKKRTHVTLPRK